MYQKIASLSSTISHIYYKGFDLRSTNLLNNELVAV